MKFSNVWFASLAVGLLTAGIAQAQIDDMVTHERVFNDFSTTVLVTTNTSDLNEGPVLSSASILETGYVDDLMGGNFANRHDFHLSRNGVDDHIFDIDTSFTFKSLVTLAPASNAPRKEAGLRINSGITGDALLIVNSDAGEIVAFGGGAPFHIFGSNGGGNGYVPGSTILLGWTMVGAGDGIGPGANTIEYFIDRLPFAPGGEETSGPLAWSNLEGGPLDYTMGLYGQGSPASPADVLDVQFNDIMYVPEPASFALGLIGIAGILGLRRRR